MFQFKAIFDEFWRKVALKIANVSMHKTNTRSMATPCQTSIKSNYFLPKKKLLNNSAAKIGEQNVNI